MLLTVARPEPASESDHAAIALGERYLDMQARGGKSSKSGNITSIWLMTTPFAEAKPDNLIDLPEDLTPDDLPTAEKLALLVTEITGHGEHIAALVHIDGDQTLVRTLEGGEQYHSTVEEIVRRRIVNPPQPVAANDNQPGAAKPPRFKLTWFDDIADEAPKETIIKGVFGVNEFTTVIGQPGAGKSVIVTDMAAHVAAGMEWHGRRVRQGLVVYVAAERKELTERRLLAFRKRHGATDVPLLVLGGRINLVRDITDARDIAAAIKTAEHESGHKCVWIIVDTLTRTFGQGDQNTAQDMGRFVQSCDELRELIADTHVTVIHHSGHDPSAKRGKGAIDLDGAVDASFFVEKRSDGTYSLVCDGSNDGPEGAVTRFSLESVEVGTDEDGEPVTAPVVVPAEPNQGEQFAKAITGQTAKALDVLRSTLTDVGICGPVDQFPAGVVIVTEEQWRQRFYKECEPNVAQKALITRFSRAKSALIAYKSIQQIGQWIWIS